MVAPGGLTPGHLERAPLVACVDDPDASSVAFVDHAGGMQRLPIGEMPAVPFVVLRPAKITIAHPIAAAKQPVEAEATLGVYLRAIRINADNGSDEEIYIRCRENNTTAWTRTNLEHVNESDHYNLWNEKIISIVYNRSVVCEVKESDYGGDDHLGSASFSPADLQDTDNDTCLFLSSPTEADLWVSKSRGVDQCPSLNFLGIHCPQECADSLF